MRFSDLTTSQSGTADLHNILHLFLGTIISHILSAALHGHYDSAMYCLGAITGPRRL